eukprot:CAMPEP_0182867718 /NCGR_PEP_ID=MMETSP0034_2-20130328/8888_1 /TAXON_ID=156128 /ORGANISM="Nephroselmis pyriformis, Strain CCMP717" /LENGTH=94 /DNA_ID=CAMNT_0025000093 /DNA_START=63 /DNA_END=344 /DNA_ORIENTATION=+
MSNAAHPTSVSSTRGRVSSDAYRGSPPWDFRTQSPLDHTLSTSTRSRSDEGRARGRSRACSHVAAPEVSGIATGVQTTWPVSSHWYETYTPSSP